MDRVKKTATYLTVTAAVAALLLCSAEALESARDAIALCAGVVAPSLLPFLVAANLASLTGLTARVGHRLAPIASRLFGLSGAAASVFVLGISGGYPIGAAATAELVKSGEISENEAERMLAFCNNSGPAFIVGAAGAGVFGSAKQGLLLYACHVLAAVTAGMLLSPRSGAERGPQPLPEFKSAEKALPEAVSRAVRVTALICGFVVTFSVLVGVLDAAGIFPALAARLALATGLELSASRALLTGLLELGSAVGAMQGLAPTPVNLALCAFVLGWGGVSVHLQTACVCSGAGIKTARHTAGRLICGALAALYAFVISTLLQS